MQMEHANIEDLIEKVEAVAKMCSVKKVFLEISKNSQENTCARVSILIKLQSWGLQLYEIRGCATCVLFCREKRMFYLHYISLSPNWQRIRFCLDEAFACADVSFRMILFRGSFYFILSTQHYITRNKISFLSK